MRWDPPGSIDELEQPLLENFKSWADGTNFSWTIVQARDDEFIGRIAIRREGDPKENSWSIGYWTHPTKQRQGYATEAARAMLTFGFQVLDAQRITAAHAIWNEHSGRVLFGIGMLRTGETDKGFLKNGEWVSEYEYAISREQFASQ
jgi:ribosomal-protein-alanine N-acetyltransferase